jgi:hypothetical protein
VGELCRRPPSLPPLNSSHVRGTHVLAEEVPAVQKRVVAFARLSKEWLCGNWSWSSHSRSNQKPPLCSWHRGLCIVASLVA